MRMVAEAAHQLSLLLDPRDADLVQPLGLDQGEGDVTVEQCVVDEINLLLATLPEKTLDLVPAGDKGLRHGRRWLGGVSEGAPPRRL